MTFKELVTKNRSYRGYDESRKITEEELLDMVDCARLTASSINIQPLKYYLAWEKEEVDRIQAMTAWARALPQMTLPHDGMHPTAFIIVCQDTQVAPNTDRFLKDVGIVSQTILLAAAEKGLGGCMIGNFKPDQVSQELQLEDHLKPLLILAIGKPAEMIILQDVDDGESMKYYRDENDVHYVPKRKLQDIIIKK